MKSNVLELAVVFRSESIVECAKAARDQSLSVFQRRWYAAYLKRIMPDLDLTRWRRSAEELSKEDREQMEREIKDELDRFEAYWKDKANASVIQASIDKINRDAGLGLEGDATPGDAKPDGGTK